LNAGDVAGAAEQFGAWKFSSGRVLPGLVRRRKAERWLFEGQDWQAALAAEHAAVKKASRD
ncbi:glycoside hydrolase family protein, partial [Xylella fastidiosa]